MPRYEIVAHLARELDCATPEEAAAVVRRELRAEAGDPDALHHLVVWREETAPAASPLPPGLRRQLDDFFAAVGRCAAEAEAVFRGRVEAILSPAAGSTVGGDDERGDAVPRPRDASR